jgi:hypothetical protein
MAWSLPISIADFGPLILRGTGMDILTFGTLPVGACFCVGATLAVHALEDHTLRKTDNLHAEYLDGSGAVFVPEGIYVRVGRSPSA